MLNSNNNRHKPWWKYYALIVLICFLTPNSLANDKGFNFIDNRTECSIRFELIDNLIVVPVKINQDVFVNLVLDTGGRSVILFGSHFKKKLEVLDKEVLLHGYGKNRDKIASLSVDNGLQLGGVMGKGIGILITKGRHFFPYNGKMSIHGIIGYQVFNRFVVSIDYQKKRLTLCEPNKYVPSADFSRLPLVLKDTKPYVKLGYSAQYTTASKGYFHIDTGSSKEVIMFLRSDDYSKRDFEYATVGKGINGTISGLKSNNEPLKLDELDVEAQYYLVKREFSRKEIQNAQGSIGSGLLNKYTVVLDYVNEYFYFKPYD
ncbi:MAG: hypothetical protein AAF843_13820 [Bacteroidota bacterium]